MELVRRDDQGVPGTIFGNLDKSVQYLHPLERATYQIIRQPTQDLVQPLGRLSLVREQHAPFPIYRREDIIIFIGLVCWPHRALQLQRHLGGAVVHHCRQRAVREAHSQPRPGAGRFGAADRRRWAGVRRRRRLRDELQIRTGFSGRAGGAVFVVGCVLCVVLDGGLVAASSLRCVGGYFEVGLVGRRVLLVKTVILSTPLDVFIPFNIVMLALFLFCRVCKSSAPPDGLWERQDRTHSQS